MLNQRLVALFRLVVVVVFLTQAHRALAAKGIVKLKVSGCDYFLVKTDAGFSLLQWISGHEPANDDEIVGEIESFGSKGVYDVTADEELTVWVEDFWLSKEDAIEKYREKCDSISSPHFALASGPAYVRGHVRKDGTYVAPHYRSAPDGDFWNNWSTKGNFNPYTGAPGTRVTPSTVYSEHGTYNGGYNSNYSAPSYSPSGDWQPLNSGWKMYRPRVEIKYAP